MFQKIIISHSEDPDGIISHALLLRHFTSGKCNLLHAKDWQYFIDYNQQLLFMDQLAPTSNYKDIYYLDLSLNDNLIHQDKRFSIIHWLATYNYLTWIDHHDSTAKHQQLLRQLGAKVISGLEQQLCSSSLVQKEYLSQDDYARWLALIAQGHDFSTFPIPEAEKKLGIDLQKIISLYNLSSKCQSQLTFLTKILARDESWTKKGNFASPFAEDLQRYQAHEQQALSELEQSAKTVSIGKRKFLLAYSDPLLPPKDAPRYLRSKYEHQADGYLVVFGAPKNQAMFFHDLESDFDAAKFCAAQPGGGGREGDGGFRLNSEVNSLTFPQIKESLVQSLKLYLQNDKA